MPDEADSQRPAAEPALLTAAKKIEWVRSLTNSPKPGLTQAAIITHQVSLLGRHWPWQRGRSPKSLSFDICRKTSNGAAITMAGLRGIGGAAIAVAIEEMAVVGVEKLIAVDIAGSIDGGVRSGDIVLVDGAIASDGTSPHYGSETLVRPAQELTDDLEESLKSKGIQFSTGLVWSTDAVYKETPSLIQGARIQGAVVVDLETAPLLAVARAVGIEAAAVLVVADELFGGWQPPTDPQLVQSRLQGLVSDVTALLLR